MIGFISTWLQVLLITFNTVLLLIYTHTAPLLVPQLKRRNYSSLTESHTPNITHEWSLLFTQVDEISVVIFYRELRTQNSELNRIAGPHGKHRFQLLSMHVYRCVAWQQTSYISVLLLGAGRIGNTVSLPLLPVFVFTELLPGNALMKSVTIFFLRSVSVYHLPTLHLAMLASPPPHKFVSLLYFYYEL
jgi:hypothetical protein